MELTNTSLYKCLLSNKETKGDSRFLFDENTSYSATDVYNITVNLADKLTSIGLKEGDVVSLRTCRSLRCAVVIFALQIIGAHILFQNSEKEANDIECSWGFANGIVKNDKGDKVLTIGLNASESKEPTFNTNINLDAPAVTFFENDNVVTYTQKQYIDHVSQLCRIGLFSSSDVSLNPNSFFEVNGFVSLIAVVYGKCSALIPASSDVGHCAELILMKEITRLAGVSEYYNSLAHYYEGKGVYPTSLRIGLIDSPNDLSSAEETLGIYLVPSKSDSLII